MEEVKSGYIHCTGSRKKDMSSIRAIQDTVRKGEIKKNLEKNWRKIVRKVGIN